MHNSYIIEKYNHFHTQIHIASIAHSQKSAFFLARENLISFKLPCASHSVHLPTNVYCVISESIFQKKRKIFNNKKKNNYAHKKSHFCSIYSNEKKTLVLLLFNLCFSFHHHQRGRNNDICSFFACASFTKAKK